MFIWVLCKITLAYQIVGNQLYLVSMQIFLLGLGLWLNYDRYLCRGKYASLHWRPSLRSDPALICVSFSLPNFPGILFLSVLHPHPFLRVQTKKKKKKPSIRDFYIMAILNTLNTTSKFSMLNFTTRKVASFNEKMKIFYFPFLPKIL